MGAEGAGGQNDERPGRGSRLRGGIGLTVESAAEIRRESACARRTGRAPGSLAACRILCRWHRCTNVATEGRGLRRIQSRTTVVGGELGLVPLVGRRPVAVTPLLVPRVAAQLYVHRRLIVRCKSASLPPPPLQSLTATASAAAAPPPRPSRAAGAVSPSARDASSSAASGSGVAACRSRQRAASGGSATRRGSRCLMEERPTRRRGPPQPRPPGVGAPPSPAARVGLGLGLQERKGLRLWAWPEAAAPVESAVSRVQDRLSLRGRRGGACRSRPQPARCHAAARPR